MNFGESISTCMGKFATFSGRASRSEYWWFFLFTELLSWAASLVFVEAEQAFMPLIITLVFGVPLLAAGSRRLHDIGKSGWWQLLAITIIGILVLIYWWAQDTNSDGEKYGETQAA
jgi:uncharacterized membrane protein YhaH (DUF805 family)